MARTEEQKVTMASIEVFLGKKKYEITPLAINPSCEWRTKLNKEMAPIAASFQATNGSVSTGLADALLKFPEKVCELVFAYAPTLPKEEIMNTASEEQMSILFSEIMVIAYPLFWW